MKSNSAITLIVLTLSDETWSELRQTDRDLKSISTKRPSARNISEARPSGPPLPTLPGLRVIRKVQGCVTVVPRGRAQVWPAAAFTDGLKREPARSGSLYQRG